MMAKTEIVYDSFCAWPYFVPYGMVERPIQKPKKSKHRRRSSAAKALGLAIFRPKVIPNKKRKAKIPPIEV
jgi:hypothetical protein